MFFFPAKALALVAIFISVEPILASEVLYEMVVWFKVVFVSNANLLGNEAWACLLKSTRSITSTLESFKIDFIALHLMFIKTNICYLGNFNIKYICILLTFNISFAKSQVKNHGRDFIGMLKMQDSTTLSFKLYFTEDSTGKIKGYTITDLYGENKTKALITGNFDEKNGLISFTELKNLTTVSNVEELHFCFIQLTNGKYKKRGNKTFITGDFIAKQKDNQVCGKGKLILLGTELITDAKKSNTLIRKTFNEAIKEADDNELTANSKFKTIWHSNDIEIEVWDNANDDGDVISLFVNDSLLLNNFKSSRVKEKIKLKLNTTKTIVKVLAINEGTKSPNTVKIKISNAYEDAELKTNLNTNQHAYIEIIRAEK